MHYVFSVVCEYIGKIMYIKFKIKPDTEILVDMQKLKVIFIVCIDNCFN